jgi:type IV secretion system protein VirD4
MSDRSSGAIGIRILAVILMAISTAALWLISASALWSKGTGTSFTPLAWWEATQWWLANWWVNLCLVLAAAAPTIVLAMLLFGLFQVRRLRYRGRRRLTAKPGGDVQAVERGVTDNHDHTQWRSMADARKLFHGPHPLHGGIVVGEAYRVDHDRSVAGIRFEPRDETSWGLGRQGAIADRPVHRGQRAQPGLRRARRLQDDLSGVDGADLDRQQRDPRSVDRLRIGDIELDEGLRRWRCCRQCYSN